MKKTFPWTLALLSALIASPIRANDDDDKKKSEKRTIEVVVNASEHDDEDGDDHKKVIVVQANGSDLKDVMADIEKQLEESKLDTETRQDILERIRKSMSKVKLGGNLHEMQVHVDTDGEHSDEAKIKVERKAQVAIVDKTTGKTSTVELKEGKPMVWSFQPNAFQPNAVQGQSITLQAMNPNLHEEIIAQLKESGVDDETIEKVVKSLKQHMPAMLPPVDITGGQAGPQFRIGVALQQNEEGDLEVQTVMEDSPAAEAGVEEGDVVVTVNGDEVEDTTGLIEAVQKAGKAEEAVKLKLMRGDDTVEVEIKPSKSEAIVQYVPAQVQELIGQLPQGVQGGFVLPAMPVVPGMPMMPAQIGGFAATNEEIESLKEEMEELKAELSELKSLIKELKDKK